jgi:hydrogenase maturation protein HypF
VNQAGPNSQRTRLKLTVRGAVQGVGFRPFVFRLATELGLAGWVNNSPQGVFIEVEGPRAELEKFLLRLEIEKSPRSFIQSLEASWLDPVGYKAFEIRPSETGGNKTALVLPDIATCPDCLREIFDPTNRRHLYPFTNCTHCGPRFSIIESLPYDRANTSMKAFTMCPLCQAEYDDPRDRRFHAQPNACPVCGPRLEFWQSRTGFQPVSDSKNNGDRRDACPTNNDALLAAAKAIREGKIVAVKGLGGFHLMVDARNDKAVQLLRERKHREEKPFALMFPSLESVKAECEVSPLEERLLCSPEAPIVLLRRRRQSQISNLKSQIAEGAAPGNPYLGAMLPYTPLHHLLMAELRFPVVATSGNLNDEPICTDEREALERLGGIADVFLVHNRPIVRHVDDSIVRVMLDRELVLRRARGYAPLPITLNPQPSTLNPQPILAVGAHLKNAVALSVGNRVFISQHIGDLETEQAYSAFHRVIADFKNLYEVRPQIIAADLHPDYLSTKFALEKVPSSGFSRSGPPEGGTPSDKPRHAGSDQPSLGSFGAAGTGAPQIIQVQHHIAHVLSCMAENEVAPPALGVSWDGTGYGTDGTIWGGEFFLVTNESIERIAHLRPFRLPGGDQAVKEPRRTAIGLLYEMSGESIFSGQKVRREGAPNSTRGACAPLAAFSPAELATLKTMLVKKLNSPVTTSMGRLFDAVASLINLRQQIRFEGQAAMELEFVIDGANIGEAYPLPIENAVDQTKDLSRITHHASRILDWSPMVREILTDVERNIPIGIISAKFHNALAEGIVAVARHAGQNRVVLSGGCFQNRYLTERVVRRLQAEGFRPYWHQRVPPNDGGIALGQVVAALRRKE